MAGVMTAAAIGGLVSGGSKIIGSLIGGGKRRREAKAAAAEFNAQKQAFQNFQFKNTYAGLENVAEDLTINQDASQFQAQQTDAALAQAMQAAVVSGGAAGGAQAIAQAALQSKRGISADIARQEQANQAARVNQEAKLQELKATGEMDIQSQKYLQQGELLNMAGARKGAADAARAQATQMLVGGIGEVGSSLAGAFGGEGGEAGGSIASGGLSSGGFQPGGLAMPSMGGSLASAGAGSVNTNLTGNPFNQFLGGN